MKRFLISLVCVAMLMSGCSSKETPKETSPEVENTTISQSDSSSSEESVAATTEKANSEGTKLYNAFINELNSSSDISQIANNLSKESVSGYDCVVNDFGEGFLNGFDADITGFNKCVGFGPLIGSIPFVTYIFETDDPAALKETLLKHADPRWNICTEADETVCEISGNYVFFVMCINE